MLAAPPAEAIREAEKVFLVYLVEEVATACWTSLSSKAATPSGVVVHLLL